MKARRRCCSTVIPINAARLFSHHAEILDRLPVSRLLENSAGSRLLEVGAGCLRNARYLQKLGFLVTVFEVEGIVTRFATQYQQFMASGGKVVYSLPVDSRYAIALATFVFETICRPTQRLALLKRIRQALTRDGVLIVSTRGPADIVTAQVSGVRCSDGFLTPNKTFSRAFTRAQLDRLLRSAGFSRIEFLHKPGTKAPEYLHAMAWRSDNGGSP
jgi:SAM-dependent methyltransferase